MKTLESIAHKRDARHAELMAAKYLYLANRASERGDNIIAERYYRLSEMWQGNMNDLLGNGDTVSK